MTLKTLLAVMPQQPITIPQLMHTLVRITLVAFTAAACRSEQPRDHSVRVAEHRALVPASRCEGPLFDGRGIGAFQIGMSADSIGRVCSVVRDTIEVRGEGLPVRVVAVSIGTDTVEAEIDSGRVWRIALTQARFRTRDSLGVGVSLVRLLSLPGVHGMMGEGALYVVSPARCGLSFRLTAPSGDVPPSDWTVSALHRLPSSSVVAGVLILGCHAPAP